MDGTIVHAEARQIELALWWHDAIYDATKGDNEAQSALLARADLTLLGEPNDGIAEVERLIRLTAGHQVAEEDKVGAVLVSIDLSILGRPWPEYERYAAAIRQEYAHVPDTLFCPGRARVLMQFLEGPIFPDAAFRAEYEKQARSNIEAEIVALTA